MQKRKINLDQIFDNLMKYDKLSDAFEYLRKDNDNTAKEQIEICQIPAPSFQEEERGKYYAQKFEEYGLEDVHRDEIGNVFGILKGTVGAVKLLIAAHLDTVFPVGTDVGVKVEETVLKAPGIGDDARGLADILSIIRAIKVSSIKTVGDIIFCGNVCEEGQGDLKGVRHIFDTMYDIDGFITIDGVDLEEILYTATGSHRYKITYKGPGGHSLNAFGMTNPIHALGRAIAKIADIKVPGDPKTTFSVGIIEGGTSINSIAYEAAMYVDMRSNSQDELEKLEKIVLKYAQDALEEENERWDTNKKVSIDIEMIGNRPAGKLPDDSVIVMAALKGLDCLGITPSVRYVGSTDANIPISLGIPALNLGSGGKGGKAHSLDEWYDIKDAYLGAQKALLVILSLAGVDGVTKPLLSQNFRQ